MCTDNVFSVNNCDSSKSANLNSAGPVNTGGSLLMAVQHSILLGSAKEQRCKVTYTNANSDKQWQ